ncbi:carboxy-S-adenosyl-L-methionine synthase CmoA [Ferrimonas sediminicola]|uniref:Carboxy-S-adenosyl-L-methionine synthase n=1 Tax=Ferrimonas sediminicola TaxID=2569538 RepID=A0A4U1BH68_9GAMM|nr:carboxy-S-adenosyl-L-methionine synthase CmoA [Ferrimonas sediminicola]TKB50571.1 carboxy-S-adenosyl-L-methionine synthase CmoA [Ferrimonas sediminicola]
MTHHDKIFAKPQQNIPDFSFNEQVVSVFPDMISRSVPGYATIVNGIGNLCARVAQPGSRIYDLGCSLGAATLSMRRHLDDRGCTLVAVDNSQAMIKRAAEHLAAFVSPTQVELICADIRDIEIDNASMVVLNFTLQFLPPEDRSALVAKIHRGLLPGGVLVVSEKLRFDGDRVHQLLDEMHLDFKRANGYSELEISQKRTALENVMKPDSKQQHYQRFQDAGFREYSSWFQHLNFASLMAIK